VTEPGLDDPAQALAIQAVEGATTFAAHVDEPRFFENAEMACRRGPTVLETPGKIPRGQLVTARSEQYQDASPHFMREGIENELSVGEADSHALIISTSTNY